MRQTSTDAWNIDRDSARRRPSVLARSAGSCGCFPGRGPPRVDAMDTLLSPAATFWQRQADRADALVRLPAHATVARELAAGACITVQSGQVWLTQTGDANDYFVGPGQRHVV